MTEPAQEFDGRPGVVRSAARHGSASSILMAAMLGLRDALGMEKPEEEIVHLAPDLNTGDLGLDLDFGDLDPLD